MKLLPDHPWHKYEYKTSLEPITWHSWQNYANKRLFFVDFWPIFYVFHRLRPYSCSKRDLVLSLFLLWGPLFMTGNGPKKVHFGPKLAKHGRLVNVPKWSKRDQNGQPKCYWPLGTLLGPSGPFWTVSNKNWYFAPKHLCQPLLCPFGAKKSFLSKMVQKGPDGPKMGPKWSKTFRLTILVPFGPFWTALECWQACHVWPFLVQIGPFWALPSHEQSTPEWKKGSSPRLLCVACLWNPKTPRLEHKCGRNLWKM